MDDHNPKTGLFDSLVRLEAELDELQKAAIKYFNSLEIAIKTNMERVI